jgi:hypothetical protein
MATIEEQQETQEPKAKRRRTLESRTGVDRIFDNLKIERLERENELLRRLVAELSLGKLMAELRS